MRKYLAIILAFALTFYSCEKTVKNIKLEEKDPKLVMYGFIRPDSTILVNLTVSRPSLSHDLISSVENGFVDIFDNNTKILSLAHEKEGFYSTMINEFQLSKEYTIKAHAPDYPEVTGNFTIPRKVGISTIDTIAIVNNDEYYGWENPPERKNYVFNVTFKDPPEENFYIIRLIQKTKMYLRDGMGVVTDTIIGKKYIYIKSNDISSEYGLNDSYAETKYEDVVYGSRGICFSDVLFSSKIKTFSFKTDDFNWYYDDEHSFSTYFIYLENISKDYYIFLKSLALYEDAEYNPFAQKVNVYSNVKGGFGIIGAYNVSMDSIQINNGGF